MKRPLAPFLPLTVSVFAGIFVARAGIVVPAWSVAALGAAALGLSAAALRRGGDEDALPRAGAATIAATWLAVAALAAARGSATEAAGPGPVAEEMRIREACGGDAAPSVDGRSFVADVVAQGDGETPFRARLILPAGTRTAPRAGDRLRLRGVLHEPVAPQNPGEADARLAAAEAGIAGTLRAEEDWTVVGRCGVAEAGLPALLSGRRRAVREAIAAALPGPEAGLAIALTTGVESAIRPEELDAFRETGVVHVLVIAGLHLAMVAAATFALSRAAALRLAPSAFEARDARPLAAALALLAATLYAALAGFRLPTRRALVALGLGSLAAGTGGRAESWNALAIGAAGLLLADPAALTAPAFVLGFLAVAGLLAAGPNGPASTPPSEPLRWRARAILAMARAARTTASAALATAPALAAIYGRVPVTGLAANLVAVPLAGIALPPLLAAAAVPSAASALIPMAWFPLAAIRALVIAAARLPFASVRLWLPPWAAAGAVVAIFGARLQRAWPRRASVAGGLLVAAAGALVPYRPPPHLTVTFLAVGQGDSAVVRTATGEVMLIDGGPTGAGQRVIVPWLRAMGVRRLDAIVVSHAHPDHTGGLPEVARAFAVREIWTAGPIGEDPGFAALLGRAKRDGARLRVLGRGDSVQLGSARVEVLGPDAEARAEKSFERGHRNDRSLVVRIAEGGAPTFLFAGDVEGPAEAPLVEALVRDARLLRADVVKVPHHGSVTSSGLPFVAGTHAALAVIEAGAGNRFGFPSPVVVNRWVDSGAHVRVTHEAGAIEVSSCAGSRVETPGKSVICVVSGVDTLSVDRLAWRDGSKGSDPGRR